MSVHRWEAIIRPLRHQGHWSVAAGRHSPKAYNNIARRSFRPPVDCPEGRAVVSRGHIEHSPSYIAPHDSAWCRLAPLDLNEWPSGTEFARVRGRSVDLRYERDARRRAAIGVEQHVGPRPASATDVGNAGPCTRPTKTTPPSAVVLRYTTIIETSRGRNDETHPGMRGSGGHDGCGG